MPIVHPHNDTHDDKLVRDNHMSQITIQMETIVQARFGLNKKQRH
jgi:hypothetical protein